MGNAYSNVPYDSQINSINAELSCAFYNPPNGLPFQYQTGYTNLTFSTTSPLVGGSGQQIYYSDVAGAFFLPPFTNNDLYNYTNIAFDITVSLDTTNASPGSATVHGSGINPIDDTTFRFTAPPVGPFTLGTTDQPSSLKLGNVRANFTFYKDGSPGLKAGYQCQRATPPIVISTTAVDDSTGPALAPSNQGKTVIPPTAPGTKYSLINSAAACTSSSGKNYNFTLAAITPLQVSAGQAFNLTDVIAFITIPADTVYDVNSVQGADHFGVIWLSQVSIRLAVNGSTTLYSLESVLPGGSSETDPQSYRFLITGAKIDLPMPLPVQGSVSAGPFTAGSSGTLQSFSLQDFGGTVLGFTLVNGSYLYDDKKYFGCSPGRTTHLFSIPIA